MAHFSVLVCFFFILFSETFADIKVQFAEEGFDFKLSVGGKDWLRSGVFRLRHESQWWSSDSTDKNSLRLIDEDTEEGSDSIGSFMKHRYTWGGFSSGSTSTNLTVETTVLIYLDVPSVVVFDIVYLTGLTNASDPSNGEGTLSSFPSFHVEDDGGNNTKKGWMTWSGNMAWDMKFGKWSKEDQVYGSIDGGLPLVVFDSSMQNAVVISPLTSFMSATQASFTTDVVSETMVGFGPLSSIDTIPAGYRYRTIMVSAGNVTSAMQSYGEIMRKYYQKDDYYRKSDYSINYLGYWTDNGACYYYYHGNYSDYEALLVAVKEDADDKGLPFRYVQLDSWWYYRGKGGGVKNWTATPETFPNGIQSMITRTGWPVVAHNRYWSPDTDYAKKFKFIVEDEVSLPNDPGFWDYLMSSTVNSWKMIVYEQDWLDYEMRLLNALRTELDLGEKWLVDMGASAERYGITIQYCMAWPRHVLQSVMVPAVTQIRVSDDYTPGNDQWVVVDATILAHAMGLAAFKDNFRSSSDQPNCTSKYHSKETAPLLQTYVSAFTGGPVAPSDMIGTADTTLLMATCMKDGRLLKPSRPTMSLDSTFLQRTFGKDGPSGKMSAAFTEIDSLTWYYVMAADLKEDYALSGWELPPSRHTFPASAMSHVAFQYDIRTGKVFGIETVSSNTSITLEKCGKDDFKYVVMAPMLRGGVALFGELNKFVAVSETRFPSVDQAGGRSFATVVGVASEVVTVTVYDGENTVTVDCVIGDSGRADLAISNNPTCV